MSAADETRFKKRSLILPVFLPSVLFSVGEAAFLPLLPARATDFGADIPTAGIIAGLVMLGTLFFDVPAARLVNRFGERNSMLVAAMVAGSAIAAGSFANNLGWLGAAAFVSGSMVSVFGLARHGYMASEVPLDIRARSLALLGGTFRFGAFVGPMLGAAMVVTIGMAGAFLVSGILCALASIVLWFVPAAADDTRSADQTTLAHTWTIAKRERHSLLTVGVGSAILGALRTARTVGLPLWALSIGLHPAESSFYIGVAGLVDFGLFYVSGQIMDKYGRRWAAIPTLLGLAFGQFILLLAFDGASFLTVAVVMSLANGLGSGLILTIGADQAPADARAEYLSTYRLLTDLGVAVTPPLISSIAAVATLGASVVTMGVISLAGAAIMWRYLPNRPRYQQ